MLRTGILKAQKRLTVKNLYISFSVPKQELEFAEGGARAARNKTNIKSGGMNVSQLASKFSFNKSLQKSFKQALKDFENVIRQMPRPKQEEIFGPDTNIYYNAEIINPDTANVINYDSKLVSIHRGGGAEFDKETGKPVEVEIVDPETGEVITGPKDVSRHANTLADELENIQQDLSDNKFKIEMDAIFNLKALEDKEALNRAMSELEDEISKEGISDNQMVIEYVMARILSMINYEYADLYDDDEKEDESGRSREDTEKLLLKRILFSNPSYRAAYGQDDMPKDLDPRKIVRGASNKDKNLAAYFVNNSKEILEKAIEPIERIIHDFSVEMLKGLESLFILDNKKEAERIKQEVSKAIKAIRDSGHEGALEILQKQMNKLKSIENVSTAAEGFVFDHDGWTYKFTGNFAPINKFLGLFKYGRKGIPAFDKLNEEIESDEKYVVLIPGGFKPPHKGHYALLMNYANMPNVEKVIVFTGPKAREGITRQMSQQIFDLYGGLSDKVEIIDHESPMRAAYSELGNEDFVNKFSDNVTFSMGCGDKGDDAARAVEFEDWWTANADKNILNVKVGNIGSCPAEKIDGGGALSASLMRKAIRHNNDEILKAHVPDGVDIEKIKDITKQSISETIFSLIEEVLNEKYEKKSCTKKGDKKGQKGKIV